MGQSLAQFHITQSRNLSQVFLNWKKMRLYWATLKLGDTSHELVDGHVGHKKTNLARQS